MTDSWDRGLRAAKFLLHRDEKEEADQALRDLQSAVNTLLYGGDRSFIVQSPPLIIMDALFNALRMHATTEEEMRASLRDVQTLLTTGQGSELAKRVLNTWFEKLMNRLTDRNRR